MGTYNPRIIDRLLSDELDAMGAIILEGPKACGKTTTAEQRAHSAIFMDDPVRCNQYLQMVETDISYILRGETPRLIDEWQIAPKIWDAVRYEVDHRHDDGQFILTGSAVPPTQNRLFFMAYDAPYDTLGIARLERSRQYGRFVQTR